MKIKCLVLVGMVGAVLASPTYADVIYLNGASADGYTVKAEAPSIYPPKADEAGKKASAKQDDVSDRNLVMSFSKDLPACSIKTGK